MRLILFCAFLAGSLPLSADKVPTEDEVYQLKPGEAPPVAPPLKKGSPLDHLANDPRLAAPMVGYQEGDTKGATFWIVHRMTDDRGGHGWGWIRKSGDDWSSAQWFALQETPGLAVAPQRKLVAFDADLDWEFKFWGEFASNRAYDPSQDEELPLFILKGYEVIGPAGPLYLKIGPPDRPRSLSEIERYHGWTSPTFDLLVGKVLILLGLLMITSGAVLVFPKSLFPPEDKLGPSSEHPILIITEALKGDSSILESSIIIPGYMALGQDPQPHSGMAVWEVGSTAVPLCGNILHDYLWSLQTEPQGSSGEASAKDPSWWGPPDLQPAEAKPYYLAFRSDYAEKP